MYKIALYIVFSLFLTSCVTARRCNLKYPPVTSKDSIYVETIKEVPVIIAGDTVNVEVPVNCPDQDLVNVETLRLKQQIRILNGKLVSSTNIKPDTVYVNVVDTKTVIKEVKVPVPEKFIPDIYKKSMTFSIIILILVSLWLGYKFYGIVKPKIKI